MAMSPEVKQYYHPRINFLNKLLLVGVPTLCWVLMVLLSLTGILEIISWTIGLLQDIFLTLWVLFLGVYSGNKNQTRKMVSTIIPVIIEILPWVDDLPAAICEMVVLIIIVHFEDIQNAKDMALAARKNASAQSQQEARYAAANAAAQRANERREQAMQESLNQAQAPRPAAEPSQQEAVRPTWAERADKFLLGSAGAQYERDRVAALEAEAARQEVNRQEAARIDALATGNQYVASGRTASTAQISGARRPLPDGRSDNRRPAPRTRDPLSRAA